MAYDVSDLVKVGQSKSLAQRIKGITDDLQTQIDTLDSGGEVLG